jgi:hypothetical protein
MTARVGDTSGAPMPALRRGWHAITLTIEEDR